MLDNCVSIIRLNWRDYPSVIEGKCHGLLLLLFFSLVYSLYYVLYYYVYYIIIMQITKLYIYIYTYIYNLVICIIIIIFHDILSPSRRVYIHLYPQLLAPQYLNCILFNFFQITSSILTILGPKVIKQIRNLKINTIQQKIYYKLKQLTNIRNHVVQKYWHLVKWNPLTVNSVTFVLDYFL